MTNHDQDGNDTWRAKRVKVALIDTGVRLQDEVIRGEKARFTGRSWVDQDQTDYDDSCGHGTHLARLLLKVTSTADILVAKVSRDKNFTAASIPHITQAIRWAISQQANIISLSLGFQVEIPEIKEALAEATRPQDPNRSPVIVFAAAANWANKTQVAFPASEPDVICISALDGYGIAVGNNPEPLPTKRIATLGAAIASAWDGRPVWLHGTSFAAPIAAGIAANVLEFAKQKMDASDWEWRNLSSFRGMQDVLKLMCVRSGQFSFLAPWRIADKGLHTAGDIAQAIREVLSLGYPVYVAYNRRKETVYVD
ncbi:peptidase S8/S53 domain-containing protein [Apodospora peruviana]|uniref:Peptidase S8/S53 domain-containing protein n=1 Tax=Apodospora peruviana TaxID=516989 RepID=A0AAE0HWD2_9PEZI|nr:peptidase S8/S53 domain-containing protein [Apodospora peruviana]